MFLLDIANPDLAVRSPCAELVGVFSPFSAHVVVLRLRWVRREVAIPDAINSRAGISLVSVFAHFLTLS